MTAQLIHEVTKPQSTQRAGHGRIRAACHRIHLAIQEMNHASRRVVELQAPWAVDKQWHSR